MQIKLLDGSIKEFEQPKTVQEIATSLAISLGKKTVGARINRDQLVPASFLVDRDVELELITQNSPEFETILNQTAAFVTLVATKKLLPKIQLGTLSSNPDEMEFNTTFHIEPRVKLDFLPKLQTEVNKLLTKNLKFEYLDWWAAEKLFANEPYQLEMAEAICNQQGFVMVYELDGVKAVHQSGLMENLKLIKSIEVQQLTGSYWNNDANNLMFQRWHGMVGISQKEIMNKIETMAERRSRDHRVINQQLEIFGFDQLVGPGLPLWLPNGTILKEEIKKYLKSKEWEYDYTQIETPIIGTVDLYKTSGHWDHYREDMFQAFKGGHGSDEEFVLRPMNCPHHIAVYKQNLHSYKDLPIRFAEHAIQHRYESSGSLTGLERVRAMELTDSHIFVRPDQVETEFKKIYQLIKEVLTTFNIEIAYLSFSVRDPLDKEKYFQDDEMWNHAESELEKVLSDLNLDYEKKVGEAAFYGPKLDIQIKTAQNHEITVSTIQLDFLLPSKFDVNYIDADQSLKHPIMIHRGFIGTYERFIATLLEQTKGVLPLWLAPVQIEILPLGDQKNWDYAQKLHQIFKKQFIRSHIDTRDERLAWKIREAQIHKTPYQLVIGDKETDKQTITYREYGQEKQTTVSQAEFLKKIQTQITEKK